ncbi:hypothetical protein [Novosphingobium terrae]|uniref:hypothetical protein n=1 Tax=Novosphingobium terrae TaxID=2726189 RepID=UPI00198163C3|nr:hypothetical protein [Novosphingobium terrae]
MLPLDNPRWTTLTHAYGSAADIPDLLRQLSCKTGPKVSFDSEPWFTLWSSLCHQGDVFDASYAALPHIVEIACAAEGPLEFSFFQLPAAIEIARANGRGPAIPPDLADGYHLAVTGLADCVALHRHSVWDEATMLSAISAQAIAKGHHRIAEAVMNLDDHLIAKLVAMDFED